MEDRNFGEKRDSEWEVKRKEESWRPGITWFGQGLWGASRGDGGGGKQAGKSLASPGTKC